MSKEVSTSLIELSDAIMSMPAEQSRVLVTLLQRVVEDTKRRGRILKIVQESLATIRLDIKYLCFDLESTRQERDQYEQRLG